jgi:dTDP-glucose 4,6-dehydratase/UDP-glucose 4-epimerase
VFSAYGEGLRKQIFWDLHKKTKTQTNEISLLGTGEETRDFIHVSDLASVIDLVIKRSDFNNNHINVANGKELSIKNVATTFFNIYRPSVVIKFQGQTRKGDPINWVADVSKIQEFGYQNTYDLKTGLIRYVKWLKENA